MKQILVMMVAVGVVGCSKDTPETSQAAEAEPQVASKPSPEPTPVSPVDEKLIVEKAILRSLKKPEGGLTETDVKKVTWLNFNGTQITNEGLKGVAKMQNLKTLALTNTKITNAGLKEVAKLQNLESLYLKSTQITDEGLKEVAKLQKLTRMDLSGTQITDEGLRDVAKLQNLTIIDLRATQVTKAGVAQLKQALPNCQIFGP